MGWFSFLTDGASTLVDSIGNAIDKNITSDEERLKLRNELTNINKEFMIKAYEFQAKEDEITQKDRESARLRETELAKAGQSNYTMTALVVIALLGTGWIIWFLLSKDIRERELAFMILGFVIAIVKDIFGFYFGSSRGSSLKDDTIRQISKQ
jgi:hypothetical protein